MEGWFWAHERPCLYAHVGTFLRINQHKNFTQDIRFQKNQLKFQWLQWTYIGHGVDIKAGGQFCSWFAINVMWFIQTIEQIACNLASTPGNANIVQVQSNFSVGFCTGDIIFSDVLHRSYKLSMNLINTWIYLGSRNLNLIGCWQDCKQFVQWCVWITLRWIAKQLQDWLPTLMSTSCPMCVCNLWNWMSCVIKNFCFVCT